MEKETQYTAMRSIILIHSIEASFETQSFSLHTVFSGINKLDVDGITRTARFTYHLFGGVLFLERAESQEGVFELFVDDHDQKWRRCVHTNY
ncbi:hypothetical protein T07_6471 [Trichinella nelsoni]|uniref:Uncharacterized protein n=1 Tax=Trichinella nelsoni TaxID=6336 RepID=A0A0V0RUF1_9BILA|nr:hypothetical protein T07_6471 [Trichinella nelsoni]